MIGRSLLSAVPVRLAALAVLLALALLGWVTQRALRLDVVTPDAVVPTLRAEALARIEASDPVDVAEAVALDLFAEDRMAPPQRYRLPGEAVPGESVAATPPARPVVLGTAIASDGSSFATCQLESSRLLMVRVGDKVGDYLVKSIDRGRVVFQTAAGERFEILALRPGS
jgi:hypothetical protein